MVPGGWVKRDRPSSSAAAAGPAAAIGCGAKARLSRATHAEHGQPAVGLPPGWVVKHRETPQGRPYKTYHSADGRCVGPLGHETLAWPLARSPISNARSTRTELAAVSCSQPPRASLPRNSLGSLIFASVLLSHALVSILDKQVYQCTKERGTAHRRRTPQRVPLLGFGLRRTPAREIKNQGSDFVV